MAAEILRQQSSNQSVQVNTEDNINVADHRNDSITQWHTSQQIHSLATENPIHTNQESVSYDSQNNNVLAQLLPPLSTLALTGESSINDLNSSSLTNHPIHERPTSTGQPSSSSVQNSLHNVVANVLISQPVSIISGTQSHFGRVTDLLGAHVLHKTKEKIWADDYIELRSLLSTEIESDPWSITLTPSTITTE